MKITKETTKAIKEAKVENKVSKKRNNLLFSIENTLVENDLLELDRNILEAVISYHNFNNYFENDIDEIETFEALKEFTVTDKKDLKVINPKMTIKEALNAWLSRAEAYIKSHVIGSNDSNALNNNTDKYKFSAIESGNVIKFTLNVVETETETV